MAVSLWQVIVNLRLTHPLCTCRPYIAAGSSYTLTHTHTHTHTHTYTLTNLYTVLLIFQSASLSWSLLRITSVGTRSHIGESFLSLSLSLSLSQCDRFQCCRFAQFAHPNPNQSTRTGTRSRVLGFLPASSLGFFWNSNVGSRFQVTIETMETFDWRS